MSAHIKDNLILTIAPFLLTRPRFLRKQRVTIRPQMADLLMDEGFGR